MRLILLLCREKRDDLGDNGLGVWVISFADGEMVECLVVVDAAGDDDVRMATEESRARW